MGTISAATLQRIYVLFLLGQFTKGSYGAMRLQKIGYIPERQMNRRPFTYRRYLFGQYSEELDAVKDQLISMNYVAAVPLDTAVVTQLIVDDKTYEFQSGGNRFFLTERKALPLYEEVLASWDTNLPKRIRSAVTDYGYLPEAELLKRCYTFPEFANVGMGEVIVEASIETEIQVALSDDECDELELRLNPSFIVSMHRVVEAAGTAKIDWDRIEKVASLSVPAA